MNAALLKLRLFTKRCTHASSHSKGPFTELGVGPTDSTARDVHISCADASLKPGLPSPCVTWQGAALLPRAAASRTAAKARFTELGCPWWFSGLQPSCFRASHSHLQRLGLLVSGTVIEEMGMPGTQRQCKLRCKQLLHASNRAESRLPKADQH